MRRTCLLLLLLAGCTTEPAPPPVAAAPPAPWPPPPVALYGEWRTIAPSALRGETLSVRADSTAGGVIPWRSPTGYARVSRWKMKYMSAVPNGERGDWRQGHVDGGEASCMYPNSGCTGLPLFCLGAASEYECEKFVLSAGDPDTLAMVSGLRFVRLSRPAPAPPDSGAPVSRPRG